MTDTTEPGESRGHSWATRRRVLQATAGALAVGAVALAGCSSNGDGNGSDNSDSSGGDNGNSDSSGGDNSNGDGSGGTGASGEGCPSLPLSYTEKRIKVSPAFVFEGPASATYTTQGQGNDSLASAEVTYQLANDGVGWLVIVSAIPQDNPTVDDAVEADSYGQSTTEVTSEYDPASEDIRVFFNEQRSTHEVYVPGDPVAVQVGVEPLTPPGDTSCPDAANATIDRIVETVRSIE
jgi:hypothetical protein